MFSALEVVRFEKRHCSVSRARVRGTWGLRFEPQARRSGIVASIFPIALFPLLCIGFGFERHHTFRMILIPSPLFEHQRWSEHAFLTHLPASRCEFVDALGDIGIHINLQRIEFSFGHKKELLVRRFILGLIPVFVLRNSSSGSDLYLPDARKPPKALVAALYKRMHVLGKLVRRAALPAEAPAENVPPQSGHQYLGAPMFRHGDVSAHEDH